VLPSFEELLPPPEHGVLRITLVASAVVVATPPYGQGQQVSCRRARVGTQVQNESDSLGTAERSRPGCCREALKGKSTDDFRQRPTDSRHVGGRRLCQSQQPRFPTGRQRRDLEDVCRVEPSPSSSWHDGCQ